MKEHDFTAFIVTLKYVKRILRLYPVNKRLIERVGDIIIYFEGEKPKQKHENID
jgi:hypothetical protein